MSILEKDIEKYLKKIKTLLPKCSYKKKFLQDLEMSIFIFVEENQSIDILNIQNHYGSPKQIASKFLTDMSDGDIDYIIKLKLRTRHVRFITTILFVWCIVALLLWGAYLYKANKDLQELFPATNDITIEDIE